jgi:uncharacterized protein (DUF58 family)
MSRLRLADRARTVRALDRELWLALVFVGLAAVGWWLHSLPLAIVGALGALTSATLYLWQRECLTGVTYRRTLAVSRANFREEVSLSIEIVNDKLLPVTWLHVDDIVPGPLELRGAPVTSDRGKARLVNILPLLPYQRVRRRITVVCAERGLHVFGPATLRSGDPVGLRTRSVRVPDQAQLLVYPKVFGLGPPGVVSRVLVGDIRARQQFLEDPSRISGVREYRAGDPLRSIDWRATARSTALLVREFEPTVSLRVAIFADFQVPHLRRWSADTSQLEFVIAIAASLLSELAQQRVAIGLFASGRVDDAPIAFPSSLSPSQLPLVLEALARCRASSLVPFSSVLTAENGRVRRDTSVVVVASDFPAATLEALSDLRRRHPVTAIWVHGEAGRPPPRAQVDALLQVEHSDDWRDNDILELAP